LRYIHRSAHVAVVEEKEHTEMAGLTLEHVGKKYPNGFEAVKDFNLDI